MESIYKITVLSNPDPRWAYPSERRYSASVVLGLGVVHLALAGIALLFVLLALTGNETGNNDFLYSANSSEFIQLTNAPNITVHRQKVVFNSNETEDINFKNYSDMITVDAENKSFVLNLISTLIPCTMCLGALGAGFSSLLAWKRWYIDYNIIWFFSMSVLSIVTATLCLITELAFILIENKFIYISPYNSDRLPPNSKYFININIFIAAMLEWIWSILSAKLSYRGMKSDYPDDINIISNTYNKINRNDNKKIQKIITPDILNHFAVEDKMYKYLPKKQNTDLPNDESKSEYRDRVNKFLSANVICK